MIMITIQNLKFQLSLAVLAGTNGLSLFMVYGRCCCCCHDGMRLARIHT